jgi:hypothetical protein
MKTTVGIAITLLFIGAFWGCDLGEITGGNHLDEEKGSLKLIISGAILSSKTIAPPIAMEVATYDIRGEGPDPAIDNFEVLGNTNGILTQHGLKPGSWIITVEARNPKVPGDSNRNGTVIGYGETNPPVDISASSVITTQIDVTPVIGTGVLDLTIEWPKGSLTNPSIVASLTPIGSTTPQTLAFAISPAGNPFRGTHNDPNTVTGYYTLVVRLFDDVVLAWGTVEAVRIINGETTSQTITLNEGPTGLY